MVENNIAESCFVRERFQMKNENVGIGGYNVHLRHGLVRRVVQTKIVLLSSELQYCTSSQALFEKHEKCNK